MEGSKLKLNIHSTIALFEQIETDLKEKIKDGIYQPGQKIPTEAELIEAYGVSRITIRRAIEDLTKEGILIKKQGKGTFVQEKKIIRKISHTISFTEACNLSSMVASSYVSMRKVLQPGELDIQESDLFSGESVVYIQRVRMADGVPVICENNYYPYSRFAFLLNESLDGSLYQLLEKKYNICVGNAQNSYIDATYAGKEIAEILDIASSEPIFLMSTEMYDTKNELIHVGKQYIVGSRYRFYLDD